MTVATSLSRVAHAPGDPRILRTGPSSLGASDRLARGLGWFSLGLGVTELVAARRIARALGMEGSELLIRGYGLREIAAGMMMLSANPVAGPVVRLAGDGLDAATLLAFRRPDNPKRNGIDVALAVVAGATVLDAICVAASRSRHGRHGRSTQTYADRSGLPKGIEPSRGLARKSFETPVDYRAKPKLAYVSGERRASRPDT
jgi:hypothetical protein